MHTNKKISGFIRAHPCSSMAKFFLAKRRLLPVVFLAAIPLLAHVGSPDIFFRGDAGPYKLLVTIRPPVVVPGVAEVEIRSASPDVRAIHLVPLRLGLTGQQFPP